MKYFILVLILCSFSPLSHTIPGCENPAEDMEKLRCGMEERKNKLYVYYLKQLKIKPNLTGEIVFEISVARSGRLIGVEVVSTTFDDENLKDQMLEVVERVIFKPLAKEQSFKYRYNFLPK